MRVLLLLASCGILGVYGDFAVVKPQNSSITGIPILAWQWRMQDARVFHSLVGKNFSVFVDLKGHACESSNAQIFGRQQPDERSVLVFFWWNAPCGIAQRIHHWKDTYDIMASLNPQLMDYDVVQTVPYQYERGDAQMLHMGFSGPSDITRASDLFPAVEAVLLYIVQTGGNVSWSWDGARTLTGLDRELDRPGSAMSFAIYGGQAFGLIVMLVSTFKLGQFILTRGKIDFSLVQIEFALLFAEGFFFWFNYAFSRYGTLTATGDDATDVLSFLPAMFLNICVALIGFYFAEISVLTTSQSDQIFKVFKIPAIVVISLTVITYVIGAIFDGVDPAVLTESILTSSGEAQAYEDLTRAIAGIGIVVVLINGAVLAVGTIMLLRSLSSVPGKKQMILRLGITMGILFVAYLALGLAFYGNQLSVPGGIYRFPTYTIVDSLAITNIIIALFYFVPPIILAFSFRVSVDKEVEVSKSATGSTSGSSSSMSSSSSASSDPVIEL